MSCNGPQHVCYCHTCKKMIKSLGIASHRKAHLRRGEVCLITYSDGKTYEHGNKTPAKEEETK